MGVQIGPKIGIEGEKEYRSQLKQIINETKNLDAAMAKTASEWTKNTSQMTKNSAVAKNLVAQIAKQEEELSIMNKMLEESAQKFGENASATQSWQRSVDYATASLNQMKTQLSELKGAEGLSEFSTQMADFGTKVGNIGQSLSAVGQKLTMSLTLPIVAAGAASVKLASDLEESRSKVEVVFGTMAESVKEFAAEALNSYGLAEGSAMQMAGTFGAMATSMGISQQQAASMSIELTALAADMASFYNVSTEVAQTSLQGVFTGETEALKKFGIVMTQTNLEAFAEQQGKVYSKMTEAEKVMTRYAYVMNATKDAQGDFARTSDGTANSLRTFQESLKELGAAFGEQLLPIITPVIQYLTRLVQAFANLPAPIQKVIVVIALIVAAIGPLLMIIGAMATSFNQIVTAAPMVVTAFSKIGSAVVTLAGKLALLAPEIAAVVLVLAAIAAVTYLVVENWDSISAAAEEMGQNVSNAFNQLQQGNNNLKTIISTLVDIIVDKFKELPGKILKALREAIQGVKDAFSQMISNAKKSGKDFIDGFVDGIKQRVSKIVDAVKDIAKTIEQYLGFSCPDKGALSKYESWMPDFMMGLAKGINQNKGIVLRAINGLTKEMALPLDANASMNMVLAGAGANGSSYIGDTNMNIYVDHISELNDLLRIQNQAQQRLRMGAR